MEACEKIEIDLTEPLANCGKSFRHFGEYSLGSGLLPYPNAALQKVTVDLSVTFLNPNVSVCGTVTCDICGSCDRCSDSAQRSFVLKFDQTFFRNHAEEDGYVYCGSKLDATKAVEDEIVLSLPTLLLCRDDCKGLCPKCGANKNHTECGCDLTRENAFSALKNLKF